MSKKKKAREVEPVLENTKDLLISAAKQLFAEKGYDGTTVKDIADKAGVNVSLVSYHFAGKEGLYRACLLSFGSNRLEAVQRILQAPTSAEECRVRIQMFMDEMLTWMMANPECCQIVQREADLGVPVARDVFASTFLEMFGTFRKFVATAQERGFFKKGFDSMIAAGFFYSSVLNLTRMDQVGKKFFSVSITDEKYKKKVIEQYISIFFNGLANDGRSTGGA